jgi:hypothetical protein
MAAPRGIALLTVRVGGAALLIASGLIHLRLWDIAYRHVKTLDVLFLVQFAGCIVLSLVVLALPRLLVLAAGAVFMAGTIVGYFLARTRGIFGFKLGGPASGLANWALIVEAVGIVVFVGGAWLLARPGRRHPAAPLVRA